MCDDQIGEQPCDLGLEDHDDYDDLPSSESKPPTYVVAADPADKPYVTTTADVIAARLAQVGVTATLIAPQTAVGLTPEDLDRIEAALLAAKI